MDEYLRNIRERIALNYSRVLFELSGQDSVQADQWLREPNAAFRGFPPLDLLWSNYGTEVLLEHIKGWGKGSIE